EFSVIKLRLEGSGYRLDDKAILDISGEPGFFAQDAKEVCQTVDVTAFAEEVASAMADSKVGAKKYDFQHDDLTDLFPPARYDFVFIRYAIGFCEDLADLVRQCRHVLKKDGLLYVSYSPASRGMCARWMFDDYTYLRLFTSDFLTKSFTEGGFERIEEYDDGSFRWDFGMHPVQR